MKYFLVTLSLLILFSLSSSRVQAACRDMSGCPTCHCESGEAACIYGGTPYCCSQGSTECTASVTGAPLSTVLNQLNPIPADKNLSSINGIINTLVPIIITIAGLILFIMLIAGGFQMLTSASNPEAAKAGQQRITTALVGFLIIFAAYWIVQIVEIVLGINIFGNG